MKNGTRATITNLRRQLRQTRAALKAAEGERDAYGETLESVRVETRNSSEPSLPIAVRRLREQRDATANRAAAFVALELEHEAQRLFLRGRDDAARVLRDAARKARKAVLRDHTTMAMGGIVRPNKQAPLIGELTVRFPKSEIGQIAARAEGLR